VKESDEPIELVVKHCILKKEISVSGCLSVAFC